jgi:aminoglycoside/choline kinase family phosphotransferase
MKLIKTNRYPLIFLLIAGLGMTTPGYSASDTDKTSTEEIKQETIELLLALDSYSVEQKDKAVEQANAALENLDNRIEKLEADMLRQWEEMDQATREKTQESLQALRQQRTRVAEWYGSMKASSASAWEQMKQGFSSAYESLSEAWENSEKEIDYNQAI